MGPLICYRNGNFNLSEGTVFPVRSRVFYILDSPKYSSLEGDGTLGNAVTVTPFLPIPGFPSKFRNKTHGVSYKRYVV